METTNIRRLGKSLLTGSRERKKCIPILVTTRNSYFMEICFARSHLLKSFKLPVYIKKFLSSSDRELEKKLLSKRYEMVTKDGKSREKFTIKNLQLFYKGQLVSLLDN